MMTIVAPPWHSPPPGIPLPPFVLVGIALHKQLGSIRCLDPLHGPVACTDIMLFIHVSPTSGCSKLQKVIL